MLAELAKLLSEYGGWGVAAVAIGYGYIERKERREVQGKFDELAQKLPDQLLGIAAETNKALADFTVAAQALMGR